MPTRPATSDAFRHQLLIAYGKGTKDVPKVRARAFLAGLPPDTPCYLSRVTWMEFVAGFAVVAEGGRQLASFTVIEIDPALWREASRVVRNLGLRGKKIGAADCLIAATALTYRLPLVSNNTRHFKEVPGLDLRGY